MRKITLQGRVLYKINMDMFIFILNTALFVLKNKKKLANLWVSLLHSIGRKKFYLEFKINSFSIQLSICFS